MRAGSVFSAVFFRASAGSKVGLSTGTRTDGCHMSVMGNEEKMMELWG